MWNKLKEFFGIGAIASGIGLLFLVFICIDPLITMWLWNWILPDITGFKEIGFWQAFGLCVLGRAMCGVSVSNSSK